MQRVVYSSVAGKGTTSADVFKIIETSARKNPERQITGFLIYDSDRFLQLVEGPVLSLQALLETLDDDDRHHSIEILHRGNADERWFPDWGMKRLINFTGEPALDEIRAVLNLKEGGDPIYQIVSEFLS